MKNLITETTTSDIIAHPEKRPKESFYFVLTTLWPSAESGLLHAGDMCSMEIRFSIERRLIRNKMHRKKELLCESSTETRAFKIKLHSTYWDWSSAFQPLLPPVQDDRFPTFCTWTSLQNRWNGSTDVLTGKAVTWYHLWKQSKRDPKAKCGRPQVIRNTDAQWKVSACQR